MDYVYSLLVIFVFFGFMFMFLNQKNKPKSKLDSVVKSKIENKLSFALDNMIKCDTYDRLLTTHKWSIDIIDTILYLDGDDWDKNVYYIELKNKIDQTYRITESKILYKSIENLK